MAKNVFISFRFSDGNRYKEYLSGLFDKYSDTIDYSEDVDRSRMSDVTIKQYLYGKLDVMLSYPFSFAVYSGSRKTEHACRQQCNPQCHVAVISGLR